MKLSFLKNGIDSLQSGFKQRKKARETTPGLRNGNDKKTSINAMPVPAARV